MASPARGVGLAICFALLATALPARALASVEEPYQPPTARSAWIAKVVYPTLGRAAPSAHARVLAHVSPVSAWGGPQQLLVLGSRREPDGDVWLETRLDVRPNGSSVWLEANDTIVHLTRWRLVVSRRRRVLVAYWNGRTMATFAVVVGKPSTPTPGGLFAVAGELAQPTAGGFEGSWVLPLTAHSGVLRHFDGGDGQVALHGRGGASFADPLGTARSHGCVRLENAAIGWLAARIPIGTPVLIA